LEAGVSHPSAGEPAVSSATEEALHALIALGYKPQEASRMLTLVEGEAQSSEEMIRAALKTMIKV
jgi:Holliday junction DNA helicase RuvA